MMIYTLISSRNTQIHHQDNHDSENKVSLCDVVQFLLVYNTGHYFKKSNWKVVLEWQVPFYHTIEIDI